jgi:hypothetical protein
MGTGHVQNWITWMTVATFALFTGCSASPPPFESREHYTCATGRWFEVRRSSSAADVSLDGRNYSLELKAGSLGTRYASPEATLIVDGNFAAFVTNEDIGLTACHKTR